MSDQNMRQAAPESPASIDAIEVEPLGDGALEEVAGGSSLYPCSVPGEEEPLRLREPNT